MPRNVVGQALLLGLCALLLIACSPGQALGLLQREAQSHEQPQAQTPRQDQDEHPAPRREPDPAPDADQGTESSDRAMIQVLIARGNFEQEQAIAARDPAVGRDTVTDRHFRQMVQTNQELLDSNVVSIKLVAMEWGSIVVRGNAATATTYETWTTTFSDGRTRQSRDRNDYRLVKQNGVWRIDANVHPGNSPLPPGARQT